MSNGLRTRTNTPEPGQPSGNRVFGWPGTKLGWWAVALTAVYIIMSFINSAVFMQLSEDVPWRQTLLPFYGIAMLLCGLAGAALAFVAIVRKHERSLFVWFALLPGLMVVVLLLGEFLVPH